MPKAASALVATAKIPEKFAARRAAGVRGLDLTPPAYRPALCTAPCQHVSDSADGALSVELGPTMKHEAEAQSDDAHAQGKRCGRQPCLPVSARLPAAGSVVHRFQPFLGHSADNIAPDDARLGGCSLACRLVSMGSAQAKNPEPLRTGLRQMQLFTRRDASSLA